MPASRAPPASSPRSPAASSASTARALDALAAAAPAVAIDLHRLAAANLAARLMRTTALLRDADV